MIIRNPPPIATTSTPGLVKPDGTTITITSGGVISSTGGTSSATWIQYVTGYVASSPPTVNATISSGTVYNYTFNKAAGGTVIYYRLVPSSSSNADSFYTTFSGGVLSGLLVSKQVSF